MFTTREKSHHIGSEAKKLIAGPKKIIEELSLPGQEEQVIYIHVPYCTNICSFCNMRRTLNQPDKNYADLVIDNLNRIANTERFKTSTIDSIYFGGGTPSALTTEDLEKILKNLNTKANLTKNAEITVETSLTDLTDEKLEILMKNGVNRLSIGIQTFSDSGRKFLNRRGDGKYAIEKIKNILSHGLKNVNIDIIYNYPGQTEDDLKRDLEIINNLDIAGFSFYSLMIIDKSKLGKTLTEDEKKYNLEKDYNLFMKFVENLPDFEFLELTKMVRKNRDEYKYIKHRLNNKDTFPLGAGAGGNIHKTMIMNPFILDDFKKYINNYENEISMSFRDEYFDLKKKLSTLQLLYLNKDEFSKNFTEEINELIKENYMYEEEKKYHLTAKGAFFGFNIQKMFYDKILQK